MQIEAIHPIKMPAPAAPAPFPHHYRATSSALARGQVVVASDGLDPLGVQPPIEFGGPGDHWSPEALLVGAISSCFVLTFRAIAREIPWVALDCAVEGLLQREHGTSRFTDYTVRAKLRVPAGTDIEAAERALARAERGCLITASLNGICHLETCVETV